MRRRGTIYGKEVFGFEDKTRVLLCKRLSGQCRDVYMVVYSYLSVYSAIFGMVTNDRTNNQVNLEQACS